MPKNIVICCDGTGNSFENPDNDSNVIKLYSTLVIDGAKQVGYYHPGVGTLGDPTARNWFSRNWSKVKGLAFGGGLLDNVGDAYRFMMDVYEVGDQVYLFGFSRGAYTVRALAGVLRMFGVLNSGNDGLIRDTQVFRRRSFQGDVQQALSAAFCGCVGYGQLLWLDLQSSAFTVYGSESRHEERTPRHID